jgi:PAS domain S-box-containing protein
MTHEQAPTYEELEARLARAEEALRQERDNLTNERLRNEQALRRTAELLDSVRLAQSMYITQGDPQPVFDALLDTLVHMTDSQFGFLDEVRHDAEGTPYKISLALSNISWDAASEALYAQLRDRNLEFRFLDNLSGLPAILEQAVIANDAPHDARAHGVPAGHPPLRSFMGLPVRSGGDVVGVVGVANRQGGYDEEMARFLEPYLNACAGIITGIRLRDRERQAVEALRESDERNRLLSDVTMEGIVIHENGIARDVNAAMARMLGFGRDELLNTNFWEFVHPDDRAAVREQIVKEYAPPYTIRMARKDGEYFFAEVESRNLRTRGAVWRATAIRDVTARRRAEEALIASQGDLQSLFNAVQESVFLMHRDGTLLAANDVCAQRLGRSVAECIGQSVYNLIPADVATRRLAIVDRVCQSRERATFDDERDGRWMLHSLSPVLGRDGTVDRIAAFAVDITEHRRAEHELRRSETLLQRIFEILPIGLWFTDAQGTLLRGNPAGVRIWGPSRVCQFPSTGSSRPGACRRAIPWDLMTGLWPRRFGTGSPSSMNSWRSRPSTAHARRSSTPRPPSWTTLARSRAPSSSTWTSRTGSHSKISCVRLRRWNRWAAWPEAWPTISTTCSASSSDTPGWPWIRWLRITRCATTCSRP